MAKAMSPKQLLQLVSVLVNNADMDAIPCDVAQAIINSPEESGRQFTEFLRNGGNVKFELKDFPTWKTIKLGNGLETAGDFRKAIMAAGMKIGDWANDILGKTASETEQEVDLVVATPKELGFSGNATYRDICDKAIELGLELCPAEVGPQLRLQSTDQPYGEWIVMAMEPIAGSDGDLSVFHVVRDLDGLRLDACYGLPDLVWNADNRFVFVRRK